MKKNLTFSKLLVLVIMAVLPFSMNAQEGKKKSKPAEKYWYIQADGGLSINHGDLANYEGWVFDDFNHYKTTAFQNWNAHLGIGYQFGKVVGMNLKGGYGLLSGHKHGQALVFENSTDPVYYDLGLDKTNYFEGNLNLTFNLFNMFKYNPRRVINLVPHIGIGGIYYQAGVVNHLDGSDEVETPALAEAKADRDLTFTVPAGMEITFNLAPKFDIFIDYTYLFTGKDDLDQVAKIKTDEDKHFINDKDMYSQLNLGLRYKFNNPCDIDKMARDSKKITYRVNPDPLVEGEDGMVCFDVITTIPAEYFEKEAVMNLKPYLTYNGGQIELPEPIIFVGEKVKGNGDFRVNYAEGGEFTKHYCIPYQEEMANCELMGDPMFYVYDGNIYPTQDEIVKNVYFAQGATEHLADGVTPRPCDPVSNLVKEEKDGVITASWQSDAESFDIIVTKDGREVAKDNVKATNYTYTIEENGTYDIEVIANCGANKKSTPKKVTVKHEAPAVEPDFIYYFDYNKYDILGNGRDVKDLNKTARKEAKNKINGDVKSIRIEGWASPEGEYGLNMNLSDNRANAGMKDIKGQVKAAKNIDFTLNGNGPDYAGFVKKIRESNIADRDQIANEIERASNKEQKVREMIAIYPELEKLLPRLRRAEVYINK